jgi:hypothetical protein
MTFQSMQKGCRNQSLSPGNVQTKTLAAHALAYFYLILLVLCIVEAWKTYIMS